MENKSILALRAILQKNKYSTTSARVAVFTALLGHEPQTVRELTNQCKPFDRASVYRTIALYEKLGILQRLYIGWKYKLELTNAFTPHHHHLSCTQCGKTTLLPENKGIERRLLAQARALGFASVDHQIEIHGLCSDCQLIKN